MLGVVPSHLQDTTNLEATTLNWRSALALCACTHIAALAPCVAMHTPYAAALQGCLPAL